MSTAHSKDNGSPTSVAHQLDDQNDSVVVRRDDLVVIDNAALGTLCEDVQIASRRNASILEVEWFRNGSELTLFQTFANRAAAAAQHGIGAARRAAPARLDGADACDAPPGAGGSVLPAMSFPSRRPLPEDKD